MKFQDLAHAFNEIEPVSSRLEITRLLSELFKKADSEEARIISYFSLGVLNPPYIGTKFNFAEKSAIKVIAEFLEIPEAEVKSELKAHGDLGSVIEHSVPTPLLAALPTSPRLRRPGHRGERDGEEHIHRDEGDWQEHNKNSSLTVKEVYKELEEIEKISGTGSQEYKHDRVLELIEKLDVIGAKYVIRILTGTLRLGFSDMTLIDALSRMLTGDKSLRAEIENEYNLCADIGLIAYNAKQKGIEGIEKMKIVVGIPIRPSAAERLESAQAIVDKLGVCVAQPKLDGFRLQVHIDKTKQIPLVKFFSRNLIDMSDMFPDLVSELLKLDIENIICEGEAISYDIHTGHFVPFQETVKRKRKHGIEEAAGEYPLKLFIFDLLYLNGESALSLPHEQRRNKLLELFKKYNPEIISVIGEKVIHNTKELEEYFYENIELGLEGLVVKRPDAIYQPGKRNFNWIKLKREIKGELADTLDCVILGYYYGSGKRSKFGIGAFLVGIYNKEKDIFQTVAKVGTGLTDAEWIQLEQKCNKIKADHKPNNIECDKNLYPDVWVYPELVCMILADEITLSPVHTAGKTSDRLGLALRFPRFMGYRPDKSAADSTTIKELSELYNLQYKNKK